MGVNFFDQYSLLHWATGVVVYFWGMPFWAWFVLHFVFEILENTTFGMQFITNFPFWPGGKPFADSWLNIIGDNVFAILGWWCAFWIDEFGKKYKWY